MRKLLIFLALIPFLSFGANLPKKDDYISPKPTVSNNQNPLVIRPASNQSNSQKTTKPLWQKELEEPAKNKAKWQKEAGYAEYNYKRGITIHTRVGMPTVLRFDDMTITDVQNGGSKFVTVSYTKSSKNSVFIKAIRPNVDVGITVVSSSGNVYTFTVRTYSIDQAKFVTDREVLIKVPNSERTSSRELSQKTENHKNISSATYKKLPKYAKSIAYTGEVNAPHAIYLKNKKSKIISPVRVWEDDKRTFFDFGSSSDAPHPVIYYLYEGAEQPVNQQVVDSDNNIIVVDRKGSFVIRFDQFAVCIIDKSSSLYKKLYAKDTVKERIK